MPQSDVWGETGLLGLNTLIDIMFQRVQPEIRFGEDAVFQGGEELCAITM